VQELDSEVKRLRTAFYNTDDPAQRDRVIKVAWDQAIKDLESTKVELESSRDLPNRVVEASRQDDSLPGWFRGLGEPEPSPNKPELPGRHQMTPRSGRDEARPEGQKPAQ
jgi:hypothetical protein